MDAAGRTRDAGTYAIMGGRVRLADTPGCPRASLDAVLLAAAVAADAGEAVVEAGAGSGAAALCLARRVGCRVDGIEVQPGLAAAGSGNAALNRLEDRVCIVEGDIGDPPPLDTTAYDHAMANPPYFEVGRSRPSPVPTRALSRHLADGGLGVWIRFLVERVRVGGTITLIARAAGLDAILGHVRGQAGAIVLFPLWPERGKAAKLVIVRARKGSAAPLTLAAGLVLHTAAGGYTDEAEAVLRGGAGLAL